MSKIFFVKLGLLSLMMISAFWLTGCLHGGSVDVTHNVAQSTGTLTGKLIDNATGEFLGGVTVAVIVNGVKQTAVTNNSSDPDLKGIFTFSGLPAGIHTFKAQVDGPLLKYHSVLHNQRTTRLLLPTLVRFISANHLL